MELKGKEIIFERIVEYVTELLDIPFNNYRKLDWEHMKLLYVTSFDYKSFKKSLIVYLLDFM